MADPVCPECGAPGKIDFSGILFCQGLVVATDDLVHETERKLKQAVSSGAANTPDLDLAFRTLSAQHVCGMKFYEDPAGSGNWKRLIPNV